VSLSQRKLARQIDASRTTLQRALNGLAAAGAVMLETTAAGTRLALA
jgi:DNA-binding GntR family transcriptional regulator